MPGRLSTTGGGGGKSFFVSLRPASIASISPAAFREEIKPVGTERILSKSSGFFGF